MKRAILSIFTICLCCVGFSQNMNASQQIIDTLCSDYYDGRGYFNTGDRRAASFISEQFKNIGLDPYYKNSYYHNFSLNVNTFPGIVSITTSKKSLSPGHEFIISPDAPSIQSKPLTVNHVTKEVLLDKTGYKKLLKLDWETNLLMFDDITHDKTTQKRYDKLLKKYTNPITIRVMQKLTWSVSRIQNDKVTISVLPDVLSDKDEITVNIEAKLINNYKTRNVVGKIVGTEQPDSIIFVTGHYDHLGRMGEACIMPGANDNASGIAMILDLASYYVDNPPKYTMVFIAFAAEEAGLVGSYFFVQDLAKSTPLGSIRFVVNMDLMGSGQEGIMAVNGAVFTKEYELLESINEANKYLPQTKKRGKAANSDHYFFTEAGVPSFFFYLMGPYSHYHDVDDTRENLTLELEPYNGSFRLIRDFVNALMFQEK